jgi:hypothetical protein
MTRTQSKARILKAGWNYSKTEIPFKKSRFLNRNHKSNNSMDWYILNPEAK